MGILSGLLGNKDEEQPAPSTGGGAWGGFNAFLDSMDEKKKKREEEEKKRKEKQEAAAQKRGASIQASQASVSNPALGNTMGASIQASQPTTKRAY